jgi:hypothetical protein
MKFEDDRSMRDKTEVQLDVGMHVEVGRIKRPIKDDYNAQIKHL